MIGFQLGREYKLSVAEILAVFPEGKTVYFSSDFLILDNLDELKVLDKANSLGGSIKVIKIIDSTILDQGSISEGKFKYGLSVFGERKNLKNILIETKKQLKNQNISSRFVNKDFKNLTSAQIIGEKLIKSGTDFNIIFDNDKKYFGNTIWVQDINAYSKRDYSKLRDMQTGMLPPKLCQIMLNIANTPFLTSTLTVERSNFVIYDPFVGLGTVLIEAVNMGIKSVYGSDINDKMVEYSQNNIKDFCENNDIVLDNFGFIKLNAKFIDESSFFEKGVTSIVSEGYLGEVMTHKNISIDRIDKQKKSLLELYSKFFEGLKRRGYDGNIVICFPFWEIKGKYIYFNEVYELLDKQCIVKKIIPDHFEYFNVSKSGSLLYKRNKQLVGREIFCLTIK